MEHTLTWFVPIDDESVLFPQVDVTLNPNEAPRPTRSPDWMDPDELALEVLADRVRMEDIAPTRAIGAIGGGRVTDIVKFQDSVSQVGQGPIADRATEHLGSTDRSVILFRSLWERELRALAEGRPLKHWHRTEADIAGV
jgi:5,5'-dehydrodivanillate O-demethylase